MPKWIVTIPLRASVTAEVDAATEREAIQAALLGAHAAEGAHSFVLEGCLPGDVEFDEDAATATACPE